jgi:hypothetical protein
MMLTLEELQNVFWNHSLPVGVLLTYQYKYRYKLVVRLDFLR